MSRERIINNELEITITTINLPYSNPEIIISINNSNTQFVLNDLLPDFWKIEISYRKRTCADPERKIIRLPPQFFTAQGALLILLHEIGHAILDENRMYEEIEEEIQLRDKLNYIGIDQFTPQELERFDSLVLTQEKLAWEYATKTYLELKQQGINIEPNIPENQIITFANEKTSSYEVHLS